MALIQTRPDLGSAPEIHNHNSVVGEWKVVSRTAIWEQPSTSDHESMGGTNDGAAECGRLSRVL